MMNWLYSQGDNLNHNFCRIADPLDPRPWCYTTDPNVKFDYCDCSGSIRRPRPTPRPTSGPICQPDAGTITRPFSFEYTKYDNNASVLPRQRSSVQWNVFGGKDAILGELPSQVNLLYGGTQLNNLRCGGTLVSSTVSAQCCHWCLDGYANQKDSQESQVSMNFHHSHEFNFRK